MRYFIVNGVVPSYDGFSTRLGGSTDLITRKKAYKTLGLAIPKLGERFIYRLDRMGSFSVLTYDVDQSNLIIKSRSQKNAYCLANSFRAVLGVYFGLFIPWQRHDWLLYELSRSPSNVTTFKELTSLIKPMTDYERLSEMDLRVSLGSGCGLFDEQLIWSCQFIGHLQKSHDRFLQAMLHLLHSHYILPNDMTGSYYEFHYSRDRKEESTNLRMKRRFEAQIEYDLAFLSAFRAIESLLKCNNWKGRSIDLLIRQFDKKMGTSFAKTKYECFHVIFSGWKKYWNYAEIIDKFLLMRNSVAAHSPLKRAYSLNEDHVYEIQYFVQTMISDALLD